MTPSPFLAELGRELPLAERGTTWRYWRRALRKRQRPVRAGGRGARGSGGLVLCGTGGMIHGIKDAARLGRPHDL